MRHRSPNRRRLSIETLAPRLMLAADVPQFEAAADEQQAAACLAARAEQLAPPLEVAQTELAAPTWSAPGPVAIAPATPSTPGWMRSVPVMIAPAPSSPPQGAFLAEPEPPLDVTARLTPRSEADNNPSSRLTLNVASRRTSPTESDTTRRFFVGDFDGDGANELAGYIDGQWWIDRNGNGRQDESDSWTSFSDESGVRLPFVADLNGDGADDVAVRTERGELRLADLRVQERPAAAPATIANANASTAIVARRWNAPTEARPAAATFARESGSQQR